ncbi:hypothetical protein DVH24_001880 [Malus domestica]|uniref:Uncharacterized protein n=1 Tax=Malus domestica TaxID=3750 RepID=A0A498I830_MALDO|nr:hypothetical protein DVH24_001880 [Malus domestica]
MKLIRKDENLSKCQEKVLIFPTYDLLVSTKAILWENDDLKAFLIFPIGVRYIIGRIRDKSTFPICLQNFLEDKLTSKLACKTDDVFPKPRMIIS